MKTQFEIMVQKTVPCDICGDFMYPMYGCGWDNDRMVCLNSDCGAEIEFPTSTEVYKDLDQEQRSDRKGKKWEQNTQSQT